MSMNITYISIYKTSLPVLVSLLMEYLIGFTDTAYLGRVGETELAASGIKKLEKFSHRAYCFC